MPPTHTPVTTDWQPKNLSTFFHTAAALPQTNNTPTFSFKNVSNSPSDRHDICGSYYARCPLFTVAHFGRKTAIKPECSSLCQRLNCAYCKLPTVKLALPFQALSAKWKKSRRKVGAYLF